MEHYKRIAQALQQVHIGKRDGIKSIIEHNNDIIRTYENILDVVIGGDGSYGFKIRTKDDASIIIYPDFLKGFRYSYRGEKDIIDIINFLRRDSYKK